MDGRTLWLWATLPKNLDSSQDQSWMRPGDAVENVQRLSLGIFKKFHIKMEENIYKYKCLNKLLF